MIINNNHVSAGNSSLLCLPPNTLRHRQVCARHFREEDRGGRNLFHGAIPTLSLPVPMDASNWPPHTGDQYTESTASIDRPEEFPIPSQSIEANYSPDNLEIFRYKLFELQDNAAEQQLDGSLAAGEEMEIEVPVLVPSAADNHQRTSPCGPHLNTPRIASTNCKHYILRTVLIFINTKMV